MITDLPGRAVKRENLFNLNRIVEPLFLLKAQVKESEREREESLDRYLLTTLLIERGKCAIATYLTNNNEGPYLSLGWFGVVKLQLESRPYLLLVLVRAFLACLVKSRFFFLIGVGASWGRALFIRNS